MTPEAVAYVLVVWLLMSLVAAAVWAMLRHGATR